MPCNIHRPAAGMLHIGCCSETGIRCSANAVLLELPHEENDPAAALPVVDITLTGACCIGGSTLTLPMKQAFVDRIVVVHGSRGVVLVRLVERDKEYIDLLVRQPFDTFPHIFRRHVVHCNQNLISGIGAMQVQRTIKAKRDRLIDKVNPRLRRPLLYPAELRTRINS